VSFQGRDIPDFGNSLPHLVFANSATAIDGTITTSALVLLDAYAKSQQADLTADEVKAIAKLIREVETRWPP
jgi:hypothetical protein